MSHLLSGGNMNSWLLSTWMLVLLLLSAAVLGAVALGVTVLWSRSGRGWVRDKLGLSEALSSLGAEVKGAHDGLVAHWSTMERIVQQMNSNTMMIRNLDGVHEAWCESMATMRNIRKQFIAQQRLKVNRPAVTTPPPADETEAQMRQRLLIEHTRRNIGRVLAGEETLFAPKVGDMFRGVTMTQAEVNIVDEIHRAEMPRTAPESVAEKVAISLMD
jgi:hypothetical protein